MIEGWSDHFLIETLRACPVLKLALMRKDKTKPEAEIGIGDGPYAASALTKEWFSEGDKIQRFQSLEVWRDIAAVPNTPRDIAHAGTSIGYSAEDGEIETRLLEV